MSLVNNLKRLARHSPAELTIRSSDVGPLADHCYVTQFQGRAERLEIEDIIRSGGMKFCGIPVRVLGILPKTAATLPASTRQTPHPLASKPLQGNRLGSVSSPSICL